MERNGRRQSRRARTPRLNLIGAVFASFCLWLTVPVAAGPAMAAEGHAALGTVIRRGADGLWRLPLSHYGYGDVHLRGLLATTDLFVGIPDGLIPVALEGVVAISPDVLSGFLEFRSGDDVLMTLGLDHDRYVEPGTRVRVPLDGSVVRDGMLGTSVLARLKTTDDACEAIIIGTRVTFKDATVVLRGKGVQPESISAFLPKALSSFDIYVPSEPNIGEADAALKVAAAALRRYAGQRTIVALEQLPDEGLPALEFLPFRRAVVIRGGAKDGLRLERAGEARVLSFSGSNAALGRQAEVFASELNALALGPEAQVLELGAAETLAAGRVTFEGLGGSRFQTSGVGRLELPFSFSQYDLGGARDLRVRVAGTYTPLTQGGSATLGLLVNGVLVRAVGLGTSGEFDLAVDVPAHLTRRDNTLLVRVDYGPPEGVCRLGIRPFTVDVSRQSYIDVRKGAGLGEGFLRYPQAFRGGFVVAFDRLTAPRLGAALDTLSSLQRLAGGPLAPEVMDWQNAMRHKSPGFFVGDDPDLIAELGPPIEPHPFRVVDASGTVVLELGFDQRFALLTAFEHEKRDVLLLTGRKPAQLMEKLARDLATGADGWFRLTGDVYLLGDSSPPVNLNLRARAVRAEPLGGEELAGLDLLRTAPLIAAMVVTFIGLTFIYPRLVRRAPREPSYDERSE